MSNAPPALVMKRAFPPVALSTNAVETVGDYGGVAGGARIAKKMFAWLPTIKVGALEELLTMPAPVILIDVEMPSVVVKL
jgi:hypothetical protein